jgi:tetratricopeptide (TPR) repeat protein
MNLITKILKTNNQPTYNDIVSEGNNILVKFAEEYDKLIKKYPEGSEEHEENSKKLTDAIKKYSDAIKKAISENKDGKEAYRGRGIAYMHKKDFEKATKDFKHTGENILTVVNLSKGTEIAKIMLVEDKFFNETITEYKGKEKEYQAVYIQSLKIMSKLQVKDEEEMPVSHYTKKEKLEKMLLGQLPSPFWLSPANTSNDFEEGKTLFRYLFPQDDIPSQVEEQGAFIGCFAFNNDCLNQFRLYGKKDDKEEGTGISISLNMRFFNTTPDILVTDEKRLLPLYRCIYIDPETKTVISLGHKEEIVFNREKKSGENYETYKKEIDNKLKEVREELEILEKLIKDYALDHNIVYKFLLNLRYLVKHVAFKEEQECRITTIQKLKGNGEVKNEKELLHVEYFRLSKDNVDKICFGPKAKGIEKFKLHLAREGYSKIECYQSKAPLASND